MGLEANIFKNVINGKNVVDDLILLDKNGVLDEVLPELTALKSDPGQKGHKDNFLHTLQVVRQTCEMTDNKWLIVAAILHDIGKAPTKQYIKGIGWTFHNHEDVGSKMISQIFKRLELDPSKMEYVKNIAFWHGIVKELSDDNTSDSAIRRFDKNTIDFQDDLLLFCKCDITTKYAEKRQRFVNNVDDLKRRILEVRATDEAAKWRCPVTGEDIMKYLGIGAGRIVGQVKADIEKAIKNGEINDDRQEAWDYMVEISKKYMGK